MQKRLLSWNPAPAEFEKRQAEACFHESHGARAESAPERVPSHRRRHTTQTGVPVFTHRRRHTTQTGVPVFTHRQRHTTQTGVPVFTPRPVGRRRPVAASMTNSTTALPFWFAA
jgi:hypothetical protein